MKNKEATSVITPTEEPKPEQPQYPIMIAMGLNEAILKYPIPDYTKNFDPNQPALIDRLLAGGDRFRIWPSPWTVPWDFAEACVGFSHLKVDLERFLAMPTLWDSGDGALALAIAFLLDAEPYEIFDPKQMAAAYFQPAAEYVRQRTC